MLSSLCLPPLRPPISLASWSNRRQIIPPELIGKIAPTRLESINLRGVFRFPVDRYAGQILPSQGAAITGTDG